MSRNLEALTARTLWAPYACNGNALPFLPFLSLLYASFTIIETYFTKNNSFKYMLIGATRIIPCFITELHTKV
jgi:hypothetical protein